MRGRNAARVAPGRIFANRRQTAPKGWRWGPKYEGGDWLVQTNGYRPWAFRIAASDTTPIAEADEFQRSLDDYIWELENPGVIAALLEAEPSTRTYPGPEQQTSVPQTIAADIIELNEQARDRLDKKGRKPSE